MGQPNQYGISASDLLQRLCWPSCRVTIGEDEDLLLDGPATLRTDDISLAGLLSPMAVLLGHLPQPACSPTQTGRSAMCCDDSQSALSCCVWCSSLNVLAGCVVLSQGLGTSEVLGKLS